MDKREIERITKNGTPIRGWRKIQYIWTCGIINSAIMRAAKNGFHEAEIIRGEKFAGIYYKTIGEIYRDKGFNVWYQTGMIYNYFRVKW